MAESLSHKFGQIIGELLELAIEPQLNSFAKEHNLYLDKKGERLARTGKKLSWTDSKDNSHDLDYVLERNGTNEAIGSPIAFIEVAWRRYTKHSKNKAQEIQGAILPLADTYRNSSPFIGVVLAGVFTENALTQLKTSGFCVLYFPYDTVITAFSKYGIDASFDEETPEENFRAKIASWKNCKDKEKIADELLILNDKNTGQFFTSLTNSISRFIERIIILALHGQETIIKSIDDAINLIQNYPEDTPKLPLFKYEIIIKYNTGDRIEATFRDKKDSINFLEQYR